MMMKAKQGRKIKGAVSYDAMMGCGMVLQQGTQNLQNWTDGEYLEELPKG